MALVVASQVIRSDILNAPFVDVARSDVPGGDQVAQPLRGVWVDLVVVRGHVASSKSVEQASMAATRFACGSVGMNKPV
ncbi:hypothetical protein [Burkholderia pseudomallei]|uniref:hypothetical protein n=1 Tax=Burkholderia pseudomallei TaxID=28450 RepID=UPI001E33BBDB|nr:hypothetical protein [Burkholderia pseudomallei]